MSFEGMDLAGARARIEPMPPGEWLLIDAAVLANAVYFAERSRARREDGAEPDNDPAVEATGPRLWDFAASLLDRFQPSHALAAWDGPKSWRKAAPEAGGVPGYKAQRPQKPVGLRGLLRLAPDVFRALGVDSVSVEGYEADDVIASAAAHIDRVVIVSNDKDFAQCLTSPRVRWWNPMPSNKTDVLDSAAVERGEWVDAAKIFDKFRVSPADFLAYQALAGDASDNVAGCPGIGAVGAAYLANTFGSVAGIYCALERGDACTAKYAEKLRAGRESVLSALRAVTLETGLTITAPPVGVRQEYYSAMYVNPFKKPSTQTLNAVTRADMAPGSEAKAPEVEPEAKCDTATPEAAPKPSAPEPTKPETTPPETAKPDRPRAPKEAIPSHESIPVRWRGILRQHIDLAAASPLRNELMIAARNAGHTQVPAGAPSMRRAALLDEIACLLELLTGALPWTPSERPNWAKAQPSENEPFPMPEPETACEPEPEPEPTKAPEPEPETAPEPEPEPETAKPEPEPRIIDRALVIHHRPPLRLLCIDCQPRSGDYVELSDFLAPVYRWVESQRKAEHWLVLPYSEGPRLAAAGLAHGLRQGTLVLPSCLVVRRAHPGAVEALAELLPHYDRASVIEASR